MGLHTPFFLFVFFPVILLLYLIPQKHLRNALLFLSSLLFVYWLDEAAFPLFIVLTLLNYGIGRGLGSAIEREKSGKWWLGFGVGINLLALIALKLTVVFDVFSSMPTGLSFFAFTAVAYQIDIYRRLSPAAKNVIHFSTYLLFFPKMIVGPITRWKSHSPKAENRALRLDQLVDGLRRFILGLAKKVLIADQLRSVLDGGVFAQTSAQISTPAAWALIMFFAVQIYYDFSGYMDMAIGLGRVFGVELPENFNLPYMARSVTDFWRRWHITLSSWFRDYVFLPLEWKRRRHLKWKQSYNTLIVFLLTGLWHGFSINFVIWGLIHGAMIALENSKPGEALRKLKPVYQHLITLFVILIAWVFFRTETPAQAFTFLSVMFGFGTRVNQLPYGVLPHFGSTVWTVFIIGVIFSTPLAGKLSERLFADDPTFSRGWKIAQNMLVLSLLIVSIVVIGSTGYSPSIYGKF
ncbi:MAG: MBOAT family protein [Anaerolineaceae bacterium]|nr:MBOAT family protein [Anaerolineaceae bacterium]